MTELDKADIVARSILGAELDAGECAVLAEHMLLQPMQKGEVLVKEGDRRRTLFLLGEGRLSVCKAGGDKETTLYQLRAGEVAGTRAFIDGSDRKAMLRADTDGAVLTLEPEEFERLVDSHPRLVYKVMRAVFRVTHANLMRMNLETAELRNYMMKTGGRY
jgi:CRP/FNR family transcriptional regulator, cyclic AMP receptor protein